MSMLGDNHVIPIPTIFVEKRIGTCKCCISLSWFNSTHAVSSTCLGLFCLQVASSFITFFKGKDSVQNNKAKNFEETCVLDWWFPAAHFSVGTLVLLGLVLFDCLFFLNVKSLWTTRNVDRHKSPGISLEHSCLDTHEQHAPSLRKL